MSREEYFTVPDVAKMLYVDVSTVRRWIYDGVIPKEEVKIVSAPDPETKCQYFISSKWFRKAAQRSSVKVTAKRVKKYFAPFGGSEVEDCHTIKATLSAKEAAYELGINYNTILKWVKEGLITPCTVNGKPVGIRFAKWTIRGLVVWESRAILRRKEIKASQNKHTI